MKFLQAERLPRRAATFIALGWLLFGVLSLRGYGITIDSPALFYAGDRTLFWMEHPSVPGALNLLQEAPPQFKAKYERQPVWVDPLHYPVFPSLLGAISAQMFSAGLGWLTDLDAHHLALVALHCVGLFLYCIYACRLLGNPAGILATLALAFFPSAVGHAFNNAKDWPCGLFYGVAMLAAGAGIVQGRARDVLAGAVLLGISFSCKMNAVFAVLTLIAWTPIAYLCVYRGKRPLTVPLVAAYLGAPYIAFALFFVLWPWLYQGNPADWVGHVHDYVSYMLSYGVSPRATWTTYPLRCLLFLTPPVILLAALPFPALALEWRDRELATWALLVMWLGVVVLRIAMPHSNFFDAARHFIEYVPALCAIAGVGASWWIHKGTALSRRLVARGTLPRAALPGVAVVAGVVAALGMILPLVAYHPYEGVYFNPLIGGLGGAQRAGVFTVPSPHDSRVNGTEGDYWFSSLREAENQLAAVLPAGATLGLCGPWRAQVGPQWPGGQPPDIVDWRRADYVYATPRGIPGEPHATSCWHELESRPMMLVAEVRRGGGVIYQILKKPVEGAAQPAAPPAARN
jgi:hypothetical protein